MPETCLNILTHFLHTLFCFEACFIFEKTVAIKSFTDGNGAVVKTWLKNQEQRQAWKLVPRDNLKSWRDYLILGPTFQADYLGWPGTVEPWWLLVLVNIWLKLLFGSLLMIVCVVSKNVLLSYMIDIYYHY